MNEQITIDAILEGLQQKVSQDQPINANEWIWACERINILKSKETAKLHVLQQQVAIAKAERIRNGDTAAAARIKVEATDLFRETQDQKAKIEMVEEQIRIAKIHAKMASEEFKGY